MKVDRERDLVPVVEQLRLTLGRMEIVLGAIEEALVWVDDGGHLLWSNSAFDAFVGLQRIALLGKNVADLLPLTRDGVPVHGAEHPAHVVASGQQKVSGIFGYQAENGPKFLEVTAMLALPSPSQRVAVLAFRDITLRKNAEDQLRRTQAELEVRSAQLEAANKDLESFSYSVSHDLRAPLRAIDGFSQALVEDYGSSLPGEGRDYLDRIRSAAQRMGRLIDDILNLSRVSRAPMRRDAVDMSAIALQVAGELAASEPDRQVTFEIQDGVVALGDPSLLRIALGNLLSNAFKFSARNPDAHVSFGNLQGDPTVYFVRDNGVGFDMKYGDKLFVPFGRLHKAEEFPGTGVGLATVKRVITRHGGTVWAEATPGEGAVFFFRL